MVPTALRLASPAELGHPRLIVRFDLGQPVPILRLHMLVLPDAVGAEQPLEPGVEALCPGAIVLGDPVDEGDDLRGRPIGVMVTDYAASKIVEPKAILRQALCNEGGLVALGEPVIPRTAVLPSCFWARPQAPGFPELGTPPPQNGSIRSKSRY